MIEKVLDNYYTKKLLEEIKWSILQYPGIDYRVSKEKETNEVIIEIKKWEYKDKAYRAIIGIKKYDSLKHLLNYDETRKILRETIESYLDGEK